MPPPSTDSRGRHLRDLRISLTDRCNLRCPYCLPAELFGPDFRFLPETKLLTFEEIERIAACFISLGVEKIRLTGGEPLLRNNIEILISRLRSNHPQTDLALTTNGLHLQNKLPALKSSGLDRVNVSLDALDPAVATQMAGREADPEKTWQAICATRDAGLPVKINTVIQRGINESQILPLATRCREANIPLRFIEFMDVGTRNHWKLDSVVSGKQILHLLRQHFPIEALPPSYPGEVARRFGYTDHTSEIGFINSITEPFCGGCTRARISADGSLYTCLFASTGKPVKQWLRTEKIDDSELLTRIRSTWQHRDDRYSEIRKPTPNPDPQRVEMWTIGG